MTSAKAGARQLLEHRLAAAEADQRLPVAADRGGINLWVVQVGIANFRSQYSWNYIMVASSIVAAPLLVFFIIFQRQIMDSIKTSGIK